MEFSRQEYWSGLPFPSSGDLPYPGIEPRSPAFQADALTFEQPGKTFFLWLSSIPLCFLDGSMAKNLPSNTEATGDPGSVSGLGRSPDDGHGNPHQ